MGITNTAKKIYEKIPKSVKYAFAPAFIRLMINNKHFQRTWCDLDNFEKKSEKEKKKYQLESLKKTLVYSYINVPYYKDLFSKLNFNPNDITSLDDIKRLPLLEKETAVAQGDRLYSTENNLAYYKTVTGGSSGQALTVLLDKNSIYKERAVVTHYLSQFGYDPLRTKTVAFFGHNKDKDFYYSPLKNEIVISPFRLFKNNQFDSICDVIEKFGATYLMGYPSAIFLFAQMLERSGRRMVFEHVVYYAENCSKEEKDYIERVLDCPVDSYYGHTERACFAEIKPDGCTFNDYYGLTELIPTEQTDEFRIVCTGFMSRKMPLIRYATDDVVQRQPNGNLMLIGHKRSEIFLLSKNQQKIFKGALTLHIEELKKIKRFQFVQNEAGKAQLNIIPIESLSQQEIANILNYINRRCEGLLDVEIKFVDKIQLSSRGKYNWAVNNIIIRDNTIE